ncbi:unnamed protein product, partial [Symbiodinium sp. CCMP2456]
AKCGGGCKGEALKREGCLHADRPRSGAAGWRLRDHLAPAAARHGVLPSLRKAQEGEEERQRRRGCGAAGGGGCASGGSARSQRK